jgi:hypothetical protein
MLYQVGEYAFPGLNAMAYAIAFFIVVGAICLAYATYRTWE